MGEITNEMMEKAKALICRKIDKHSEGIKAGYKNQTKPFNVAIELSFRKEKKHKVRPHARIKFTVEFHGIDDNDKDTEPPQEQERIEKITEFMD